VLNLAAALAAGSTHPLSRAIAALQSDAQKNQFASWQEIPGAGIQATHQGRTFKLGALRWLAQANRLSLAAESEAFVNEWNSQGASIVALADNTQLLALFAVRDTLKPGAQAAVAKIQSLGLKTYLVTGDTALTASAIAKEIGIPPERVFSEIRPEGKAGLIKTLQGKGERIAFVGDGLNDAPALEQADLGIAVSKASDIAREAADIILLKADIEAVPQSLGLARATLRTIKQNLFWAFFYNALGIPLAALGFMNPMLCAAAMGLSDLVVIGNALRLKRWR
jgi:Cu+-exporting ATPase